MKISRLFFRFGLSLYFLYLTQTGSLLQAANHPPVQFLYDHFQTSRVTSPFPGKDTIPSDSSAKIALLGVYLDKPDFFPLPILDVGMYTDRLYQTSNKLKLWNYHRELAINIRNCLATQLTLQGYDVLYDTQLQNLHVYNLLDSFSLKMSKANFPEIIPSRGDRLLFPIKEGKVGKYVRKRKAFQEDVKTICAKLGVDAICFLWGNLNYTVNNTLFSLNANVALHMSYIEFNANGELANQRFVITKSKSAGNSDVDLLKYAGIDYKEVMPLFFKEK